jgi:hypothetical protein
MRAECTTTRKSQTLSLERCHRRCVSVSRGRCFCGSPHWGFDSEQQRKAIIQQEGLGLAHLDLQRGRNPSATLYALAKERGFDAGRQQRTEAGEQRLQRLSAGMQQARSLGTARGSGPRALTPQRALEMSDKDFAALMETEAGLELLGA